MSDAGLIGRISRSGTQIAFILIEDLELHARSNSCFS
jgi:hypothetical protein